LGRCSLETIQSPSDPSRVIVKPTIFDDVDLFKTFFSPTDREEKAEKLVISILNHSKKFCEDIGAMANAIGVTTRAIEYIAERILPDKIILFSIIKRYEEEIKNQREIAISPKLLAFSDNIACEADMKLIIKALNEFSKLDDCDDEMRNAVIAKVDELLMKN